MTMGVSRKPSESNSARISVAMPVMDLGLPALQSVVALLQTPVTQLVYACHENQSISFRSVSREASLTVPKKSRIQFRAAPPAASGKPKPGPVPAAGPPTMTPGKRRLIAEACATKDLCAARGVPSQYFQPYTYGSPPQFCLHPSNVVVSPLPVFKHVNPLYSFWSSTPTVAFVTPLHVALSNGAPGGEIPPLVKLSRHMLALLYLSTMASASLSPIVSITGLIDGQLEQKSGRFCCSTTYTGAPPSLTYEKPCWTPEIHSLEAIFRYGAKPPSRIEANTASEAFQFQRGSSLISSYVEDGSGTSADDDMGNMHRKSHGPPRSFGRIPGTPIERYKRSKSSGSANCVIIPVGLVPPTTKLP
mmetsp:Transcript_2977/g.8849  ORF Transcript_2977/g.8849 Transcript_2977/m.8849 type:complete len:361 (-) Transcript_2977:238-1320(-)